jgi:hypothetical protein
MSTSPRVAVTNPLAQRIGVGRVRQVASLDRCMPPTITNGDDRGACVRRAGSSRRVPAGSSGMLQETPVSAEC